MYHEGHDGMRHTALWSGTHITNICDLSGKTKKLWSGQASLRRSRRGGSRSGRLISSYIRSWERPGDLPRAIEILCLFASGAQRIERKETQISITSGRSPGLSQQRM
jgi:hypothetical protein